MMKQYTAVLLATMMFSAACSDDAGQTVNSSLPDAALADMGAADASGESDTASAIDTGATDMQSVDDASSSEDAGTDAGTSTMVPFQTGVAVETATGPVRGEEDDGLRVFRGIPFAEPPVDDLRLEPTVPVEPWTDELDATEFGPSCIQDEVIGVTGPTSEDCLTLNVWAHPDDEPKPVMVWIYGGGFITGGSAWDYYDGAQLAENGDVVVISINYRLGPLGYLAIPELKDESSDGSVGNYGLLDQLEALRWVRENAPAFGGDPENVTVFGESAGGFSICALIGTERGDDLFDKAIMQSGGCQTATPLDQNVDGLPSAYDSGVVMMESIGCEDAADPITCLRGAPAEDFILDTSVLTGGLLSSNIALGPVLDGVVLKKVPYERIADGEVPARPLIAGSNGNEGAMFTAFDVIFTRFDLRNKFEEVVDEATADELMALYDAFTFPVPKSAWEAFVGEVIFSCNSYHSTEIYPADSYYYYLNIAPLALSTLTGPLHGTDIFYTFGNFSAGGIIPTLVDLGVRDLFQSAWSNFAWTGAPGLDDPTWPTMSEASPEFLQIELVTRVEDEFRAGRCDELRTLGLVP